MHATLLPADGSVIEVADPGPGTGAATQPLAGLATAMPAALRYVA